MKRVLSLVLCLTLVLGIFTSTFADSDTDSIISVSESANFVIKNDGSLWGWGADYIGNGTSDYGDNIADITWTPVKILEDVRSVSASHRQRAAVKKDNSLWMWGPLEGEFNGEYAPVYTVPTKVLEDVEMVSVSRDWTMVLKTDGSVWVNGFMTGDGTQDYSESFTKVADNCKYIAASVFNAFYINDKDELWGYGYNDGATLGNMSTEEVLSPIKILDDVREINAASPIVFAIRLDNSLYSWGNENNTGVYTENGWVEEPGSPYKVMDDVIKAKTDTNGYQYAVLKTDHSLWAWGDDDDFVSGLEPIKLYDSVRDFSIGSRHISLVFKDNTLGTAGDNYYKVLGHGDIESWGENIPMQVIMTDIQDSPASWAYEEVEKAIGMELIPNEMQGEYTKPVTREEFCILAIRMIEVKFDMTIDDYIEKVGVEISPAFEDCDTKEVLIAKSLGIAKGISETKFAPDLLLNREMAAVFLTQTAQACGRSVEFSTPDYADVDEISDWAKKFTGYVFDIGLLTGTTGNRFAPKDSFQRQQAFMTMYRIWKVIDQVDPSTIELP